MFPLILSQEITVTFNVPTIVTWAIIGLVAGSLASVLIRGRRYGLLTSLIVGLAGALIGGILFTALGLENQVSPALRNGVTIRWIDIIVAFVGAVIVLLILGAIYRVRRP